jgi:signal transduction histidine kinase
MPGLIRGRWTSRWRHTVDPAEAILVVVRIGVLALCILLSLLQEREAPLHPELLMLTAVAVMASIPLPSPRVAAWRPHGEAALAAIVLASSAQFPEPLLPYLVVPLLAAGLLSGAVATSTATVIELVVLVSARSVIGDAITRTQMTQVAEWVGLGFATGLVCAWTQSVLRRAGIVNDTYVAAHGLLMELREVARQLPTGLDEVALAQQVLGVMGDELGFERAALYSVTEAGVLVPLAVSGTDRVDWTPELEQGIWAEAWHASRPVQQSGTFGDPGRGSSAVLVLQLGDRRVGLVGIERESGQWTRRQLIRAQTLTDDAALRIDTGQLFSEVRALATLEERRRLAREIHDGIAQEIASLGYLVDDLRARTEDPIAAGELEHLRSELSRLVTELRLSIFDLRSDVQPATGLGAALSSYVRGVGTDTGLTVHLILDESAHRLPIEAETELLRIAQEAITNARKHARARNLWVTCRVDPPRAFLRVADDGQGLGSPRADSYGLEIMKERTSRLGAALAVRARVGGGTVVEVTLGSAADARSAPFARPLAPVLPAPGPSLGRDDSSGDDEHSGEDLPRRRPRRSARAGRRVTQAGDPGSSPGSGRPGGAVPSPDRSR